MSAFARWGRFNLVGMVGVVVQLSALALFNRTAPGHYLAATAAAVELTLLHNFAWHFGYTWRGRVGHDGLAIALLRFHLANGLLSLTGNLALMRVLVQVAHVRVILANGVAIVCCALVNFSLSEKWVFMAQDTAA